MSILCSLQNLSLSYGPKQLFRHAQLTVRTGDKIGLLGLNGKGKSSLLKVLGQKVFPDKTEPPFLYDKSKDFQVFLIPQEVSLKEFPEISIKNYFYSFYPKLGEIQLELEQLNKLLEKSSEQKHIDRQKDLLEQFEQIGGWELLNQFESYLKFFGLEDINQAMKLLSGGEQKKVLLSLGFSCQASLILWDEPTNHLDMESIKVFEEELANMNSTFILVTHDRYLLNKCTNKIIQVEHGEIRSFEGSYADYLTHLANEEAAQKKLLEKLKNNLRRETAWMRQGIKARGTRSKKRVENYHGLKNSITEIKEKAKRELTLSITASSRKTKALVEFQDVSFGYDQKNLFEKLNFRVMKGDRIGLLGANGTGKSTLVKLISSKLLPSTGIVKKPDDLIVQYFSQKREELKLDETPFQLLGEGSDHVILPNGSQKHVASYFESFLFHRDDLHRPIKNFSGGEKNRLQMALNFLRPGDFWIFDEPTNDLDLETLHVLEDKLISFPGSLIIISHDRAFLSAVSNRVWLLENQSIEYFEGGYEQVEPYLEALSLEKSLRESEEGEILEKTLDNSIREEKTQPKEKIKLTNKEKQRLKVIDSEIAKCEKELENLNQQIESYDFTAHAENQQSKYEELSSKQERAEERLLLLYEELEQLQEKQALCR